MFEHVSYIPVGSPSKGYLASAETERDIPFEIRNVFWIFGVPPQTSRGGHAHRTLEQVFFCLKGELTFRLKNRRGKFLELVLNEMSQYGVLIEPWIWRELVDFAPDTILLCLSSESYQESEYIRDWEEYLNG